MNKWDCRYGCMQNIPHTNLHKFNGMFLEVYWAVSGKNVYTSWGTVNDVFAIIEGQVTISLHIRPQGVFCVFILDPEKIADFHQHQVDNLLLVWGLSGRAQITKKHWRNASTAHCKRHIVLGFDQWSQFVVFEGVWNTPQY